MENIAFESIAGYEGVKKELLTILSWFNNKNLVNNKKLSLPKGVLLYGKPGNGKTLFLREYAKMLKAPCFVYSGTKTNKCEEMEELFKMAREHEFSVIIIDELDRLIDSDSKLIRILQSEMDGFNKSGHFFVLATANSIRDMPNALLRQGRFDRLIPLRNPNQKDIIKLYKKYIADFDLDSNKIDFDIISKITESHSCCCADIASIINDAYLRSEGNVTTSSIVSSIDKVISSNFVVENPLDYRDYRVAIHEAGHVLNIIRFKKDFSVFKVKFLHNGALTTSFYNSNNNDCVEKRIESIQIALGGSIAEKMFFKKSDIGSVQDYEEAFDLCRRLIKKTCYKNLKDFSVPVFEPVEDRETPAHRFKTERKTYRLLMKIYKETYKYMKKYKNNIKQIADLFYEKGEISYNDIKNLCDIKVPEIKLKGLALPFKPQFSLKNDMSEKTDTKNV